MLQHLVNVQPLLLRGAVGAEQAVDQVLQPVRLADDHAGVFAMLGVRVFALQQLGCATDAAERVLDLVRQAADQFAAGLVLREQQFVARDAQVAVQRLQLHQQARLLAEDERRHGTVHGHRLVADPLHAQLALDEAGGVLQAAAQPGLVGCPMRDRLAQGRTNSVLPRDAEQVLAGRVQRGDAELVVEPDHRSDQAIEHVFRLHGRTAGDEFHELR